MKRIPPIKAVMTPFPYAIDVDAPLVTAQQRMAAHGFRHLPVTAAGRLVGVISDRDLSMALGGERPQQGLRVRDLGPHQAYAVDLSTPLDAVLLHMARNHLGAALVVKEGKLVGIFTTTDACRVFGDYLRDEFRPPSSDDAA